MTENNTTIWIGIAGLFAGIYGWLIKHVSGDKHISEGQLNALQTKETCEAHRDCIEVSVKNLKEYVKERFDKLEDLIQK